MNKLIVPILCAVAGLLFIGSIQLVFFEAPLQYGYTADGHLNGSSLFWNQKIFYWHVAHAFWLFGAVFCAGAASIMFLWKRDPRWDDIASASVDVAIAFGAVVLLTGSIWAKAAWDVWWNWEPRLTMSLLLWVTLVGYAIVRKFAGPAADRIAAGMAIFGMVGVPFIYKMVGEDSHPASGKEGVVATLGHGMKGAFWLSVVAFLLWFIALTITRVQGVRFEREVRELRERGLDLGVLK
ncbi:MAG TPA: cytochrome c biogenesis protein CcsA [Kofleriaceae bacterium]|jgi:heme exporter protein C|nr:cytochrome c biogenesis protein CcsA [Kofleriaceae bacterium]